MYRILIFILATLLFYSCNESEFLKESPKDETYAENLFSSLDGFNLAKNALLNFPRQERSDMIQSAELGCIWKIGTDVAWANTELSWSRGLNQYTQQDLNSEMQFLNGDTSGNPGIFLILYRCISSANLIISRADNNSIDWQGSSEEEDGHNKNEIIAHAKLIRAWAYRHLVMTFGPVPLNIEEINGSNYRENWERNSIEEIQGQIEKDLLFAEEWLPDNAKDVTRLSKVIAQHYLAELYLWQGRYEEAEKKAYAVVSNPNFSLITKRFGVKKDEPGCPFMDQFYNGNILPSQGNTETLWAFPNSDIDEKLGSYENSLRRSWVVDYSKLNVPYTPEYGGRGIGRLAITAWVFSLYEPNDDRFSEYAIRKEYIDKSGKKIVCQTDEANMKKNNHKWASTRKWDWTYDDANRWGESYSFADQAYLRLADTYLLLAEALFRQGKNSETDGAAYWINKVRTRSNATPITANDVTLDFILDERARELITEECRRETLYRTGTLIERTRKYNPIASGKRDGGAGIQDFHILLPIPQKVIDANTGEYMKQNEGY